MTGSEVIQLVIILVGLSTGWYLLWKWPEWERQREFLRKLKTGKSFTLDVAEP